MAQLLRSLDYNLQGNRKAKEGKDPPDRDGQFQYLKEQVRRALAAHRPAISVDTKKKESIGNYENKGQKWRKAKTPVHVNGHDFPDPSVPRAYPYGIYDLGRNTGFVNVGTDHDTSAFAAASIRGWWRARPVWWSKCVISRRARASGTRWSTACFRSFPRTGAANRCATTKPSFA